MTDNLRRIVLGGGCFWCLEAVYKRIEGVTSTRPGYAGGHAPAPSYEDVCTGKTGHAEVVEISFNLDILSQETILNIFWKAHDPTTPDRQGNDAGTQYRSIILYADEEQQKAARESMELLARSGVYLDPPVTQIVPLGTFWPAEGYHKDYFEGNRSKSYCRLVIEPKLNRMSLLKD